MARSLKGANNMIVARQDKSNKRYIVTFSYDPNVIYMVKQVPGRRWHPDSKYWTIPDDRIGFLISQFKGTVYESQLMVQSEDDININASLDSTADIPDIDISKIPFYVKEGATPYDHQLDFMKYAIDRQQRGRSGGFLLGDDPGLGKTVEAMNLALYNRKQNKLKRCLIICCVNSAKYNWRADIIEHTKGEETPYIIGSRMKRSGAVHCNTGGKEKLDDLTSGRMYGYAKGEKLPFFLILNIEALRYKSGRSYPIVDTLLDMINKGEIGMIVVDEIHKNASPTSMQGKQLLQLKKKSTAPVLWVPMTGTPIVKKPTDVFTPMKLIGAHQFNSYYAWCKEFCIYGGFGGHDIVGYKNIPRLKAMVQDNMLRRLKKDVLDLPPVISYTEYVENTPYQQKLYNDIAEEIIRSRDTIMTSMNPLAKLLRLRQVNGAPELVDSELVVDKGYLSKNAKLQRALELLAEAHERGEKTIIFSNWVEPLRTLYKFVSKLYRVCAFTGTMSVEDREANKIKFQTDPAYTVMLGTIGAMGVSQTLTAASNVIFYDEPWNPGDKQQATERAYRIGTQSSVNVWTLMTKDTVDDRVHDILCTKEQIATYIMDGQLDLRSNPQLFDLLLSDSIKK